MNKKKIFSFSLGPILGAAISLISVPVVAHFFSVADVGRLSMLQIASSFSVLLFSLGLDQAYVREYHENPNKPRLLRATALPGLVLLIVAILIFSLLPFSAGNLLFGVSGKVYTYLLFITLIAGFISRYLSLILRMQERGLAFSLSTILPKILFLSIVSTYILFASEPSFLKLLVANALSIIGIMVFFIWNTQIELKSALKESINKIELEKFLKYGAPLILGGLAFWGVSATDRFCLRTMSTFEELGIYSVAFSFASVATIFQSVFSTVWAPTVYKWAAQGINTHKIDHVTEHLLTIVCLVFCLGGSLSWIIPYFLPSAYANIQYLVVSCLAYPLLYTLSEATAVGIGISRKTIYGMGAAVTALLINVISNYLLIPQFGANGAAAASALAFLGFLIVRTEASAYLWRQFPRKKIYIWITPLIGLSIAFTLFGNSYQVFFYAIWTTATCLTILGFRHSLFQLYKLIKNIIIDPPIIKPLSLRP